MSNESNIDKNAELLADFTAYCRENPSFRFWQALRNWSGNNFILVAKGDSRLTRDTYYSERKDGQ